MIVNIHIQNEVNGITMQRISKIQQYRINNKIKFLQKNFIVLLSNKRRFSCV